MGLSDRSRVILAILFTFLGGVVLCLIGFAIAKVVNLYRQDRQMKAYTRKVKWNVEAGESGTRRVSATIVPGPPPPSAVYMATRNKSIPFLNWAAPQNVVHNGSLARTGTLLSRSGTRRRSKTYSLFKPLINWAATPFGSSGPTLGRSGTRRKSKTDNLIKPRDLVYHDRLRSMDQLPAMPVVSSRIPVPPPTPPPTRPLPASPPPAHSIPVRPPPTMYSLSTGPARPMRPPRPSGEVADILAGTTFESQVVSRRHAGGGDPLFPPVLYADTGKWNLYVTSQKQIQSGRRNG
ncbi:hypothetical protein AMATHDRAFT_69593 [Amanita thiersii Skay4041]|uniref:Uncharacterized protein n=1 Tax=Amanita thiersii Skay4041 TaxID=703135 RepID=A0A2A9N7Q0_9AGAR|nr:hypothetical protein AMATHDRAFT_69593 [Amanita thiersii Skay4041]